MNKEMREMDGAFGQSGHCEEQGSGDTLGRTGRSLVHPRKGLRALKNHISSWNMGGTHD